ncbi:MAG: arginine decarboxylase [Nocardioidaceae bacterium]|jgi:arginine/lysine/ornithine decarboxylase|nr:arginine decarboxylase [Nocardioidaceae bacterium]
MDHSRVPVLEVIEVLRRRGDVVFGPPGHHQGRGVDPRVLAVMGEGVFSSDIPSLNGLDDRRQSQGILSDAQQLMADAVGAEHAFFSTCGSSLSVKSAMAHPPEPGNVRRALEEHPDAKGMLLTTPTDWGTCADIEGGAVEQSPEFHLQGDLVDPAVLKQREVLIEALRALVEHHDELDTPLEVKLPSESGLQLSS